MRHAAEGSIAKGCDAYPDFRDLIARKDIDAVLIGIPDHWHCATAVAAVKSGKDVYCEKPLTLTTAEAKVIIDAVRRHKRVLQTGSQQRSDKEFRVACEAVRNGGIGKVQQVFVSVGGPSRPCDPPEESGPIEIIPPEDPKTGIGLRYIYANGVEMIHGGHKDPDCMDRGGVHFVGENGIVYVDRGQLKSWPENIVTEPLGATETPLYKSPGHHQDWLNCIRNRKRPICDVETGARSVTVCHLGNLAY